MGHERPVKSSKKSEGMPSSHAATLCYWLATTTTLLVREDSLSSAALGLCCCAMVLYVSLVLYARIGLTQVHTVPQVAVGAALGIAFSRVWDVLVGLY